MQKEWKGYTGLTAKQKDSSSSQKKKEKKSIKTSENPKHDSGKEKTYRWPRHKQEDCRQIK